MAMTPQKLAAIGEWFQGMELQPIPIAQVEQRILNALQMTQNPIIEKQKEGD